MNEQLKGATVLIIGGSSGIGLSTAILALAAGATVTIASHDPVSLASAVAAVRPGVVSTLVVDTFDNATIEELFSKAGMFQHIVVTAAWSKVGGIHDLSLEDAYKNMDSKFWGSYKVARAAQFAAGGSLTLISGSYSQRPSSSAVLQGAINAAIETLVRGLALELAPVRVNAISPGLIDTPLYASMDPDERKTMMENAKRSSLVHRVGRAEDIARAILFCMTSGYLTGTVLPVDGGSSLV